LRVRRAQGMLQLQGSFQVPLQIAAALASLASSLYKFAFDLRLLQSPSIGEWSEGFAVGQVGSSAMPFKRNPIDAEKIDSLGRMVAHMIGVTWDNGWCRCSVRPVTDHADTVVRTDGGDLVGIVAIVGQHGETVAEGGGSDEQIDGVNPSGLTAVDQVNLNLARHGARVALFGRKINLAESPLASPGAEPPIFGSWGSPSALPRAAVCDRRCWRPSPVRRRRLAASPARRRSAPSCTSWCRA
ncbi:hypothetical protein B4Q13_16630, partial [Lacticaseibacillus rhamnosus]